MSEMIADYELVAPMSGNAQRGMYIAVPPGRLGLKDDRVLLKVLQGISGSDTSRRIARELRIFAAAKSPYLVRLYDAGQDGNRFYYSMEYMTYGSLAAPTKELSRQEIIRALHHAAVAAHQLHEVGLAHRDIQPGTILLNEDGGKLADLGLAGTINPNLTVTAMAGLEAVEYVDPAVLYGARPSRRSDIFSLGATLHKALTGEGLYGPLASSELLFVVRKILSSQPTVAQVLEEDESRVIQRCIDPDASQRYQTAEELSTDLIGLLR